MTQQLPKWLASRPLKAATWMAALTAALTAGGALAAPARPYTPGADDEIVERLPARADASQRAQRTALAREPRQLPLALAAAQQAIVRARQQGDPRELGAAQAALAPWWNEANPPAPVRLLRATLRQSHHEFDRALGDLDALIHDARAPVPLRAQALLTRATVHQVRGHLDQAQASCEQLMQPPYAQLGDAVTRPALACQIELRSLRGDPRTAQRQLDGLAARSPGDTWLALLRAELAERLGDDADAQRHYATAAAGGEVYALAAYADWLLDRGRAREALAALAQGPAEADALLLRRAIAWRRLGDAQADIAIAKLRQRFAAARQRGDAPHLREEARLALDIDRDGARALTLAQAQWAVQREPADAVLLWRSAQAARRPEAARVLETWVPDPRRADVRLAANDRNRS